MGAVRLIVTADASVLIVFAKAGELRLLQRLFERIQIPPSVAAEATHDPANRIDAQAIQRDLQRGKITIRPVPNPFPAGQHPNLGAGERDAIALARGPPRTVLLIDDWLARRVAELEGVEFTGTLGILAKATQAGLVEPDARDEVLERLLAAGLWISSDVLQRFRNSLSPRAGAERDP